MWIFECVKNYSEMRAKISKALFCISLIEIFILAQISPDFSDVLKTVSFNTETEILGIKIYVAYIYIPLTVSVLENIFSLHDKIGKLFKIRHIFSKKIIFLEYIKQLNINTKKTNKELIKIYSNNKELSSAIGNHFYYHVSSTNPKIDDHYVHMALTAWSWVWIILDTVAFSLLFELFIIIFKACDIRFILGFGIYILLLIILLFLILFCECKKCTINEIKKSVDYDKKEKNEKNQELKGIIKNALSNKQCNCKNRKRCPFHKTNK